MKKLSIFLFFVCLIFFNSTRILASEQEELDVMIIEINPTIKKIDSIIYPDNHPKVTDYFQQSVDGTIKELKEDLESTSHGYLKVNIVEHEYLDEYPKYNKQITLNNGTQAYQLDEETYLAKSGYDGSPIGDWYNLYSSGIFDEIPAYSFDYDYIIDKYDLIEKRENGDFEQLWLITIDPAQTFETIMVGQNPFWINGPGYVASCPNFMIINVSVSRRDANLHALGHGVEGTMTAIFSDEYETINGYGDRGTYRKYNPSFNTYNKDVVDINKTNYADLNYWEKYTLGIFSNKDEYTSVGNIHFPFNGTSDYDYSNSQKVYTNWKEWLDYPNINGKFELDDNTAWLLNAGNDKLGDDENKDPDC